MVGTDQMSGQQKIHSLLMRPELVDATIRERKTNTLRLLDIRIPEEATFAGQYSRDQSFQWCTGDPRDVDAWQALEGDPFFCPYGVVGDRLSIRENYRLSVDRTARIQFENGDQLVVPNDPHAAGGNPLDWFRAARAKHGGKLRPSIFLPSWAVRVRVVLVGVSVIRVQDIDAAEAIREGIPLESHACGCEVCSRSSRLCPATESSILLSFRSLWDSIHKPAYRWAANPWVWSLSYKAEPRHSMKQPDGSLLYYGGGHPWS